MPISIHALRVEGDSASASEILMFIYFYPRPPGGGRQLLPMFDDISDDISIHALRVEGDGAWSDNRRADRISIHALRVEGDT